MIAQDIALLMHAGKASARPMPSLVMTQSQLHVVSPKVPQVLPEHLANFREGIQVPTEPAGAVNVILDRMCRAPRHFEVPPDAAAQLRPRASRRAARAANRRRRGRRRSAGGH